MFAVLYELMQFDDEFSGKYRGPTHELRRKKWFEMRSDNCVSRTEASQIKWLLWVSSVLNCRMIRVETCVILRICVFRRNWQLVVRTKSLFISLHLVSFYRRNEWSFSIFNLPHFISIYLFISMVNCQLIGPFNINGLVVVAQWKQSQFSVSFITRTHFFVSVQIFELVCCVKTKDFNQYQKTKRKNTLRFGLCSH